MAYLLDLKTIIRISHQHREQGKRVVLTHGTFDLLHLGHILFLKKSKKLGDILIVGADSDRRIKEIKGTSRPILNQKERLALLAELNIIDFIFIIDHKEPGNEPFLQLYKKINPNYVTYGSTFPHKKKLRKKIEGIKFIEIRLRINTSSTSKIIKYILEN